MYRCVVCKRRMAASQVAEGFEYRGEWCGRPAYEPTAVCPYCGEAVERDDLTVGDGFGEG